MKSYFCIYFVHNVDGLFSGAACESGSTFYFAKDGINEQSNEQSSNSVAKAGDKLKNFVYTKYYCQL